jgi:hypothetical protein
MKVLTKIMRKHRVFFLFFIFSILALFLTFNRHSKSGFFNYHSEIWADKAAYYVYLPATIKYSFNPAQFPDSIDIKTGEGFRLDNVNQKIITRVTYGVALLQLPFFLAADATAKLTDANTDGFSPPYHRSINVASVFYLLSGMFFLRLFLKKRYGETVIFLTLLSLFLATNLYYYSIDETGMSHVYSFSLFSLFLYITVQSSYMKRAKPIHWLLFGILCGLIVLVRPTNIVFLSTFLFLDIKTKHDFTERIMRLIRLKSFLPMIAGILIIFLPQFLYWSYAYGTPVYYSYGEERFQLANPQFLLTLLSPDNGLLLYSPFFLIIITGIVFMLRKKIENAGFIAAIFLIITYVFSSWSSPNFGCSFGARSYVEFLAIFSIPVAFLYKTILNRNKLTMVFFWLAISALAAFSMKMTYSFDECFYGTGPWDWKAYFDLVIAPTK